MDSEIKSVSHRHAALQEYPGFIMGSDLMFTALWGKNQGRRGAAVEEFPSVTAVGNDRVHSADPSGYEPHCQQTNRGKKKSPLQIQTCTYVPGVHGLEADHLAGKFANRKLSSVFPAGHLTVVLFPSWLSRGQQPVPALLAQNFRKGEMENPLR